MKLKKGLAVIMAAVLLLGGVLGVSGASAVRLDDFTYEISSGGITITKYNGTATDISVREFYTVNGITYRVVRIGEYAFENAQITAVSLPESLTEICEGAFYNCDAITSVTVPESVTTIGLYAFDDCNSLTDVTVENSNATIGESAFGYYYSGRKYYIVENFVMHGTANSTAQEYAAANGMTFELYNKPVTGDVNNDGVLNIMDLIRLKKILAGAASTDNCNIEINGDSICSAEDLVSIRALILCGENVLKTYTVIFKDNSGNILDTQTVKHSFAAVAPNVPQIENYKFTGWSESFLNVMKDMEIYAQYVADNKPTFTVSNVTAYQGDKDITLAVNVKNNPGILGMTLSLEFDDKYLELTNAANGDALIGVLNFTKANVLKSGCRFVWDGQELTKESIKNGAVLYLTFNISADAPSGNYPINISYKSGDIIDGDLNAVDFEIENGVVVIP